MKIKEIISEVEFKKSYPYSSNNTLISKIKSRFKPINTFDKEYTFKDDLDNTYKVRFYHYENDVVSVDFSLENKIYLTKTTYDYREKTGIGIEFRILSTVINIIKEYISKNNPTVLLFSADEFHYDSYRGIVKRLIKNTNYVDVSNSYVRQIKDNEVRMVINGIFKNSSNVYSLFILCRKDLVNVENVSEGKIESNIITDNIGGTIKITPDPLLVKLIEKFSISYINRNMAIFYKVNNRIIGLDSHGHTGKPEPHLHLLQKSKRKGFIKIDLEKLDFRLARHLFYNLLIAMKKKYKKDKK